MSGIGSDDQLSCKAVRGLTAHWSDHNIFYVGALVKDDIYLSTFSSICYSIGHNSTIISNLPFAVHGQTNMK